MSKYDKPLTDEEYEQMRKDHAALQAAYKADPEGTLAAAREALAFPAFEGELED